MADTDIKKLSVTRNDVGDVGSASVWHWMLNPGTPTVGEMPAWWSPARDWYLRQALYTPFHDMWSGAIGIAITKMSALSWEVESDAPRLRNYAQQLLLAADANQSWVSFLSRHLQDFLCADNGAFIEVVRAGKAAGSRIVGLMHLDSQRITRTGDPAIPAVYRDTLGNEHELKDYQVLMLSDMPSPAETWHGVGFCAASRAWGAILELEAVERYIYEKVSGKRPLAVHLIGGISEQQMTTAIQSAEHDRVGKGYVSYMGVTIIPTISDVPITLATLELASVPDGFDRKQEFDICVLQIANAIGLDVQDLQPLTGQALGTGMQSEVLDNKSQGKGLAAWRQQFTHLLNQFVMPGAVTFAFSERDIRDQQQVANVSQTRVGVVGTMIDKQIINPSQAAQILADEDELPKEFVPVDQTPAGTLTDADQPDAEQQRTEQPDAGALLDTTAKEAQPAEGSPFRIEEYRRRYAALSR